VMVLKLVVCAAFIAALFLAERKWPIVRIFTPILAAVFLTLGHVWSKLSPIELVAIVFVLLITLVDAIARVRASKKAAVP
jgi:hypothetical protein